MPYKQQALTSLGFHVSRRLNRIDLHNCDWDAFESEDLTELLVDGALMHGDDKYWKALLKLRGLSHAFRQVVNAKLDVLLAELRNKAGAVRVEFVRLTQSSLPRPDWIEHLPAWIEEVHAARSSDPTTYSAYAAYRTCMDTYL